MIMQNQIITDLKIESVNDLYKLKPFMEGSSLKINKSQIARELDVDRRTVDKYINGYEKPSTRASTNCIEPYYDIIAELLSDNNQQVFYYRKVLWQYLVDNHNYTGVYCNFATYLRTYPEFGYTLPTIWACSGLTPVRARPWRANRKKYPRRNLGYLIILIFQPLRSLIHP